MGVAEESKFLSSLEMSGVSITRDGLCKYLCSESAQRQLCTLRVTDPKDRLFDDDMLAATLVSAPYLQEIFLSNTNLSENVSEMVAKISAQELQVVYIAELYSEESLERMRRALPHAHVWST